MKKLVLIISVIFSSLTAFASGMPVQANKYASQVDSLYDFLLIVSLISCILVIGGMIYFVLKYKRKTDNDDTPYISHNNTLEFLWSFIPFIIFLVVFAWGWKLFHDLKTYPENAFEVHVFGRQWGWDFQYKSGRMSTNEFVVPVGKPVKLIMTSTDVLHSFFIPSMRIKQDVVPGMYTSLWFEADYEGEFQVYCTEYCGKDHSLMLAKLKVVSQAEFDKWLSDDPMKKYEGMDLASRGKIIVKEKACTACHSFTDNKVLVGPSLKGAFGQKRTMTDGTELVFDEKYIIPPITKRQEIKLTISRKS
jgi:cytochrome c oxidase subunit 2